MSHESVRENLATQLRARGAFSGVDVFEYPPGAQAKRKTTLFFTEESGASDLLAFTGTIGDDTWQLLGSIYAIAGGPADSDFRAAAAAANAIFDDLRAQLRDDPTVNGACKHARLVAWTGEPSQDDQGTVFFDKSFTLDVRDLA